MAKRVRLVKERVRLDKEDDKKIQRVRLEEKPVSSTRVRLSSSSRVRLEKPSVKEKYSYSSTHPHLHTRIVAEKLPPGQRVEWIPCRIDGKILYDRILVTDDNRTARLLLNATSPYGLASRIKQFQGVESAWIPGYLKNMNLRQRRGA